MELLTDVVFLSRLQFAICIIFHFLFVPLSIGLGLILALAETRYYRSRDPKDGEAAHFWVKIFTITFAVGVATGITMEFSFGTNWADYSRFVGDIFGAPLAAEALLAFFLESSFLGVLLFGRKKVSPRFYMVAGWLVWLGSCLSALWIIIANSWMQTPAGYEVVATAEGVKAVITDFWAAALNPSTGARYFHTVDSLLIMGAFVSIAIGAYHVLKKKSDKTVDFGKKTMRTGTIVALITLIIMVPAAHQQAVVVANEQPTKFAAMEGHFETGTVGLSIIGWVDEDNRTTHAIELPLAGATSWLASGSFDTEYEGLNEYDVELWPGVNITFQSYHLMVLMFGLMVLFWILAFVATRKKSEPKPWMLKLLMWGPIAPFIAIQSGWMTAEVGRQPWIVWGELKTEDAISQAVSATDLQITIVAFLVFYAFILVAYLRIILRIIRKGPEPIPEKGAVAVAAASADTTEASAETTDSPAAADDSATDKKEAE